MSPCQATDRATAIDCQWDTYFISSDDGLKLHSRVLGGGNRTCLLVHGYGEGAYIWTQFGCLLGPSYKVVAIDLRGHGNSEWSRSGNYGLDHYVRDTVRVIEALCEGRIFIIGHSLGGNIALHIAALNPERIAGLVVIDFGPNLNPVARARARSALTEGKRAFDSIEEYAFELKSRRPFLSTSVAHQIAKDSLRPCAYGFELKFDPAVARLFGAAQSDDATSAILADIRCPIFVVRGALSAILAPQAAERMVTLAKYGKLQTIQRAGHAVVTDNPEEFSAAVLGFLGEISKGC
jgi:pimeloyl-ACP methyl ester carboxylesterase